MSGKTYSMKNTRPSGVTADSQPEGRGPSDTPVSTGTQGAPLETSPSPRVAASKLFDGRNCALLLVLSEHIEAQLLLLLLSVEFCMLPAPASGCED